MCIAEAHNHVHPWMFKDLGGKWCSNTRLAQLSVYQHGPAAIDGFENHRHRFGA